MTLILSRYLAVTSMMGATIELASDLKISGDAQVKGISVKGDTSKWNDTTKSEEKLYKDKQVFDSEINLNLDFKVDNVFCFLVLVALSLSSTNVPFFFLVSLVLTRMFLIFSSASGDFFKFSQSFLIPRW